MKINSDLRMAVRSAYNVQKRAIGNGYGYEIRHKAENDAIAAFLKSKPKAAKVLREAKARLRRDADETNAACQTMRSFGLENGYNGEEYRLTDNKAFAKAGGRFNHVEKKQWSFDQVMVELAAADEKHAASILAKFGINWK